MLPGTATERSAQVVKMTECLHTEEHGRGLEPGLNYGAWRDNVSPDWNYTNWEVETFILEQENIDNGLSMSTLSIDDKGKRPAPPPSLPLSHSKRPKTTSEHDGKNS